MFHSRTNASLITLFSVTSSLIRRDASNLIARSNLFLQVYVTGHGLRYELNNMVATLMSLHLIIFFSLLLYLQTAAVPRVGI